VKYLGSLENIFSDISASFNKRNIGPMSTVASDIVSVGDSWLSFAIKNAIIEPVRGVEEQDWFKGLSDKWKVRMRPVCVLTIRICFSCLKRFFIVRKSFRHHDS